MISDIVQKGKERHLVMFPPYLEQTFCRTSSLAESRRLLMEFPRRKGKVGKEEY